MAPFEKAFLPTLTVGDIVKKFNISEERARRMLDEQSKTAVAMNDKYQVNISKIKAPFGPATGDVWWLSIKRRDKQDIHDWRALQEIKNAIIGPEHEGFEIYPAESRLVDTSNQFHLWVFDDPNVRLPVGWQEREVITPEEAAKVGAVQRPFEKGAA